MEDQVITGGNGSDVTTLEAEVDAEVQRIVPDGFRVHDPETAAWVVRKVVAARSYVERVKTWSAIEQRRGQQEEQRLLFLFEDQLRCWTEGELSKLRGRGRSIALPPGTLSFRAIAARLLVVDEAKVFSWARTSCPAAVVVTEKLLKTPIMRHFEESGELPPGCDIAPAETAFYIR